MSDYGRYRIQYDGDTMVGVFHISLTPEDAGGVEQVAAAIQGAHDQNNLPGDLLTIEKLEDSHP